MTDLVTDRHLIQKRLDMIARIANLMAFALLLMMPHIVQAQTIDRNRSHVLLDPIECYRNVGRLNVSYRSDLTEQCFLLPARICESADQPEICLGYATDQVKAFLDSAAQSLPENLPLAGIWPNHYRRAVIGVTSGPQPNQSCHDAANGSDAICAFLELWGPVMDAFRAARLAGIRAGFEPSHPFQVTQTDDPHQLNPISCFAAVSNLGFSYASVFSLRCVSVAERLCKVADDADGCRLAHISAMRHFVEKARPLMASIVDHNEAISEHTLRELAWLDDRIADLSACRTGQDAEICEFTLLSHIITRIFEIIVSVSPERVGELMQL